ncbi:MAG: flagellar assembly protein FliW, partial [Candidatus Eremiobacteraeota bacterium]|nr:flagellar assembly protein FliW [Candidatus Eremiobacteraeota bacterium]
QLLRTVNTTRFGELSIPEEDVFVFRWGLPGFGLLREFVVLAIEEQKPYVWLQSLERPEIALPLIDPWALFEDYDPALPAVTASVLEIERPDDFCLMCVTVVGDSAEELTVNLLAPIVFNLRCRIGRQVMLEDSDYSVRTPVPRMSNENEDEREEANSA